MDATALSWLERMSWTSFSLALASLVIFNVVAIIAFFWRRERANFDAWTGPVIGINTVIVAIGIGVPIVTSSARLAILGVRTMVPDVAVLGQ